MDTQRRLKGLIVEFGIDQKDLADLLGISRESFNKKINGKFNFTLNEAFVIASYFERPIDDIFLPPKFTQSEQKDKQEIA